MAGLLTIASTRRGQNSSLVSRATAKSRVTIALVLASMLIFPALVRANEDVDRLLARPQAPEGVVFEIVESDEDALDELLPRVRTAIAKIRARFPQTEFAVVYRTVAKSLRCSRNTRSKTRRSISRCNRWSAMTCRYMFAKPMRVGMALAPRIFRNMSMCRQPAPGRFAFTRSWDTN